MLPDGVPSPNEARRKRERPTDLNDDEYLRYVLILLGFGTISGLDDNGHVPWLILLCRRTAIPTISMSEVLRYSPEFALFMFAPFPVGVRQSEYSSNL